jgi:galactokinase
MIGTYRAPGRVNLIGEHTDHTGGLVLPVAIDLGVTVTAAPSQRITLRSLGLPVDVAADGSGGATGWGRYVSAVAAELYELGRPAVGIEGVVEADLPRGAGLASSAALAVAVALALCDVARFTLEPVELVLACNRAELRAVGVPCGILDQAAAVLARSGHALFLDCGTLVYEHVPLPTGLALLVVDSGEAHAHERSGYVDRLRELRRAVVSTGDLRPSELTAEDLPSADDPPSRRLRHVMTENRRVRDAVAALKAGDVVALGPIFAESHRSLRDDYEVSTPTLDRLVAIALDEGALAARLTGGGFGGSIVVVARSEGAESLLRRVVARAGGPVAGHVVRASDGARAIYA